MKIVVVAAFLLAATSAHVITPTLYVANHQIVGQTPTTSYLLKTSPEHTINNNDQQPKSTNPNPDTTQQNPIGSQIIYSTIPRPTQNDQSEQQIPISVIEAIPNNIQQQFAVIGSNIAIPQQVGQQNYQIQQSQNNAQQILVHYISPQIPVIGANVQQLNQNNKEIQQQLIRILQQQTGNNVQTNPNSEQISNIPQHIIESNSQQIDQNNKKIQQQLIRLLQQQVVNNVQSESNSEQLNNQQISNIPQHLIGSNLHQIDQNNKEIQQQLIKILQQQVVNNVQTEPNSEQLKNQQISNTPQHLIGSNLQQIVLIGSNGETLQQLVEINNANQAQQFQIVVPDEPEQPQTVINENRQAKIVETPIATVYTIPTIQVPNSAVEITDSAKQQPFIIRVDESDQIDATKYNGPQHHPIIGIDGVPEDTQAVQEAKALHFAHKSDAYARNGDQIKETEVVSKYNVEEEIENVAQKSVEQPIPDAISYIKFDRKDYTLNPTQYSSIIPGLLNTNDYSIYAAQSVQPTKVSDMVLSGHYATNAAQEATKSQKPDGYTIYAPQAVKVSDMVLNLDQPKEAKVNKEIKILAQLGLGNLASIQLNSGLGSLEQATNIEGVPAANTQYVASAEEIISAYNHPQQISEFRSNIGQQFEETIHPTNQEYSNKQQTSGQQSEGLETISNQNSHNVQQILTQFLPIQEEIISSKFDYNNQPQEVIKRTGETYSSSNLNQNKEQKQYGIPALFVPSAEEVISSGFAYDSDQVSVFRNSKVINEAKDNSQIDQTYNYQQQHANEQYINADNSQQQLRFRNDEQDYSNNQQNIAQFNQANFDDSVTIEAQQNDENFGLRLPQHIEANQDYLNNPVVENQQQSVATPAEISQFLITNLQTQNNIHTDLQQQQQQQQINSQQHFEPQNQYLISNQQQINLQQQQELHQQQQQQQQQIDNQQHFAPLNNEHQYLISNQQQINSQQQQQQQQQVDNQQRFPPQNQYLTSNQQQIDLEQQPQQQHQTDNQQYFDTQNQYLISNQQQIDLQQQQINNQQQFGIPSNVQTDYSNYDESINSQQVTGIPASNTQYVPSAEEVISSGFAYDHPDQISVFRNNQNSNKNIQQTQFQGTPAANTQYVASAQDIINANDHQQHIAVFRQNLETASNNDEYNSAQQNTGLPEQTNQNIWQNKNVEYDYHTPAATQYASSVDEVARFAQPTKTNGKSQGVRYTQTPTETYDPEEWSGWN